MDTHCRTRPTARVRDVQTHATTANVTRVVAIAVIVETPIRAPHSQYNFTTRRAADAEQDGWLQLGIAFWVPAPPSTPAPPPQPPVFPPERQLRLARP